MFRDENICKLNWSMFGLHFVFFREHNDNERPCRICGNAATCLVANHHIGLPRSEIGKIAPLPWSDKKLLPRLLTGNQLLHNKFNKQHRVYGTRYIPFLLLLWSATFVVKCSRFTGIKCVTFWQHLPYHQPAISLVRQDICSKSNGIHLFPISKILLLEDFRYPSMASSKLYFNSTTKEPVKWLG